MNCKVVVVGTDVGSYGVREKRLPQGCKFRVKRIYSLSHSGILLLIYST